MRAFSLDHGLITAALTGLAVVAFAAPSLAGTVYKWTTESGTTSFTDDPKRIPARYKESAERRQTGSLRNYSRFTVAESTAKKPYAERVDSRIAALRQTRAPAAAALESGQAPWEALQEEAGRPLVEISSLGTPDPAQLIVRTQPSRIHEATGEELRTGLAGKLL